MTNATEYPDGAPCWADLATPDLDGARRFYGALLGWSFDEPQAPMGNYVMCRRDGKTVAGMAPAQPGTDTPTAWSVYLRSGDVDAVARKLVAAGGRLLAPPMDIPPSGRMLFAADPTGAVFGVWQPQQHRGAELFGAPGGMCWNEVNTRDGAATDAFYRTLFDYQQQQIGGDGMDYAVWSLADKIVCGRLQMTAEWEGIPPHWLTYFAVDDCDRAAARARELGGAVKHGPFDSPHGRIAVVVDPDGAVFSIIDMGTTRPD